MLANSIQEFVLLEVSPLAIDEMFRISDEILNNMPLSDIHPILVDSRIGTQPLGYTFIRMRELARRHPNRKTPRMAFILHDSTAWRMLEIFMRPFAPIRIFTPDERAAALAWLSEVQA